MMPDTTILVLSAILTWLMLCTSSGLRIRAFQPGGIDRAAKNMVENLAMFIALVAAAHFAGKASEQATLGANIFFWSRLAFWPSYLAGITYLRTLIWLVSILGMAMIAAALVS